MPIGQPASPGSSAPGAPRTIRLLLEHEAGGVASPFVRGGGRGRAVKWLGLVILVTYARQIFHALARWVRPSQPVMPEPHAQLLDAVSTALGAAAKGESLAERLGRDVWVDYFADAGDDASVSSAVASMIFSDYEWVSTRDPRTARRLPRGDLLVFGGDAAYPIATRARIEAQLVQPFSRELELRNDGMRRVLLGIPGNHDHEDGRRGFRHLFVDPAAPPPMGDTPLLLADGAYVAVQRTTSFALRLTPDRVLLGADHPAKSSLDPFLSLLAEHPGCRPWWLLPKPLLPFGETEKGSRASVQPGAMVTAGDLHHYRREQRDGVVHVTSGGGGASLHPVAIGGGPPADREFPGRAECLHLLWGVVPRLVLGQAGILPHLVLIAISFADPTALPVIGVVLFGYLAGNGGALRRPIVAPIAAAFAGAITLLPTLLRNITPHAADFLASPPAVAALSALLGPALLGLYMIVLGRVGSGRIYAFSPLAHPGFRHFIRLRFPSDGAPVEVYCIGAVDPLRYEAPTLIDHFEW